MNCEVVQEKLSCYLDGVVDEATMEMIEDHLSGCSECRAELAALQALAASMSAACEVEPPTSLKAAICEAIDRERVLSPECEMVLGMLSEFVDGELAQNDRMVVQQHVDNCEDCAQELVMMQRAVAALGSLGEVAPPVTLNAEIAAAVAEAKRSASPLARLIEKTRLVLQPANLRWTAGAVAATAVVVMATVSPLRQRDVVTVSEKPRPQVVSQPVAPAPQHATSQPAKPAAALVATDVHSKTTPSLKLRKTHQSKPAPKVKSEKVTIATATRESNRATSETLAVDSKAPGNSEPTSEVAKVETPAEVKTTDSGKTPEATEVVAAKPEETKKEPTPTAAKPAPVKVATEQPVVASQDDKAYIRSLKQQIRMKRRDEGIKVDLLDVKF